MHTASAKGHIVAPNASIIGDVVIGRDYSIWFNTVIRGDVNSIRIADRVNTYKDGTVLHNHSLSEIHHRDRRRCCRSDTTSLFTGCHIRPFGAIGMGAVDGRRRVGEGRS